MEKPVIASKETVLDLARNKNNPRNSEGDFALLNDGRILFAYSRYTGESAHDDASCDVAGLISTDGGRHFTPLYPLLAKASDHGVKNIMSVSLKRLPNGELCLFYLCKHTPQSEMYLRRAVGNETAFGAPERIFPVKKGIYYVVNNCRVCITSDGRVLIPAARHKIERCADGTYDSSYFSNCVLFAGDASGRNWTQENAVFYLPNAAGSETGLQEPGVTELPDGGLYAYFRTDRGFQFESISKDGCCWTQPRPSAFTSPDSPMLIARNPYTGLYYAFWNPIPKYNGRLTKKEAYVHNGRTPFVTAVSEDGLSYSEPTVIEDDPDRGFCYPAVFFADEKTLLLSYCCGGKDDGMCLTRTRITRLTLA
ncbi:MAG: exo-alpha-sialidase [Clostridia bacterium]|nr:exo-alpha-sialidase [Clostridia bacterium]